MYSVFLSCGNRLKAESFKSYIMEYLHYIIHYGIVYNYNYASDKYKNYKHFDMTCFTKALQQFMQTCFDQNCMFNIILKWTSDLMWYDKIK